MPYCTPETKVWLFVNKNELLTGFDGYDLGLGNLDGTKVEIDGMVATLHVSPTGTVRKSTEETVEYTTLTISVDEVEETRIIIEVGIIMMA